MGRTKEFENIQAERLNQKSITNKGYIVQCVVYNNAHDIIVEFQDEYKARIHTSWQKFKDGSIKNPYHPSVYDVGIPGNKYPIIVNRKTVKEYDTWRNMLKRCYDVDIKKKRPTYQEAICCDEWLLYDNFYEWMHCQENFKILSNIDIRYALDKDILIKGNKTYSPETCCLVPDNVNELFIKRDNDRGLYPVGVTYYKTTNLFNARCSIYGKERIHLGLYNTPEDAFYLGYKPFKEKYIQQVAKEEYGKGSITKECYDAMMKYEVEITD